MRWDARSSETGLGENLRAKEEGRKSVRKRTLRGKVIGILENL